MKVSVLSIRIRTRADLTVESSRRWGCHGPLSAAREQRRNDSNTTDAMTPETQNTHHHEKLNEHSE
jgi:hypothetical protein